MANEPDRRFFLTEPTPSAIDPELAAWLERLEDRIKVALSGTVQAQIVQEDTITKVINYQPGQDSRITELEKHPPRIDNPHSVTHAQLPDKGTNTHAQIDAELARLEQVKLDIVDALQVFSFAAYGQLEAPLDSVFPDIGLAFQKINILTDTNILTARGITVDSVNSTFAYDYDGIYRTSISGSFEHNSSNQGRITYIRFYDETAAAPIPGQIALPTGRNAEATTLGLSFINEITEAMKGHVLSLQIGGGDVYTTVVFNVLGIDINAVGEWREPLG